MLASAVPRENGKSVMINHFDLASHCVNHLARNLLDSARYSGFMKRDRKRYSSIANMRIVVELRTGKSLRKARFSGDMIENVVERIAGENRLPIIAGEKLIDCFNLSRMIAYY
jgi:hypothetical protein